MAEEIAHEILYPTPEEIINIHDDIISEDEEAESGYINKGTVDYAVTCIQHGHFGEVPETIHEKAVTLMRLLSANHPFVDGNKRTALNSTWLFYAMNGLYFDYGEEIKAILKMFAVMERMVDQDEAVDYFEDITYPEDDPRVPSDTIRWIHLPKWRNDLAARYDDIHDQMFEEGFDTERYFEYLEEFGSLAEELVSFRDDNAEELPDEVVDDINQIETEMREIAEFFRDLADAIDEGKDITDVLLEHTKRELERGGLDDEQRKRLEEVVDDLEE